MHGHLRSRGTSCTSDHGVVSFAIGTVLERKAMLLDSTRINEYKEVGRAILERIVLGEAEVTAFDNFSTTALHSQE